MTAGKLPQRVLGCGRCGNSNFLQSQKLYEDGESVPIDGATNPRTIVCTRCGFVFVQYKGQWMSTAHWAAQVQPLVALPRGGKP
jgi:ribosomal protein L37E